MNKKTITILLAVLLLVAFFLPYISIEGIYKLSGFEIVFGKNGKEGIGNGSFMFISLLIPIGAILILLSAVTEKSSTLSGYVYWMPLVGIIYLSIRMYLGMDEGARGVGGSMDFGMFIKVLAYAYWVSLVASVAVLITKQRM